jgi:ABC-type dipeptide/oligopeptide/nickel transport system permease component
MTRSTVLEVLNEDFVRTARAKGLVPRTVLARHVMRNAMIPVITVIGLQVAAVFGGSVIIESIFNLPGLGHLLLEAVTHRDYPVVQGAVLFIGATVIVVNLLVDLTYGYLDPRIRFG